MKGREVYRKYSPGRGLRERSSSRGYRGSNQNFNNKEDKENQLKEIKTMLCDLTKKVGDNPSEDILDKLADKIEKLSHNETDFTENETSEKQKNHDYATYFVDTTERAGILKIDSGAPKSISGISYMKNYLESIGLDINKQQRVMTPDVFLFGPTRYRTLGKILCPIKFKDVRGDDFWIQTDIHLIDNKIGILLGLTTCDQLDIMIMTKRNSIAIDHINQKRTVVGFRSGNHIAIPTQHLDKYNNEKAPVGAPSSWKTSVAGKVHNMYIDILKECETNIRSKITKTKVEHEEESDNEEYEDAIEEINTQEKTLGLTGKLYNVVSKGYEMITNFVEGSTENIRQEEEKNDAKTNRATNAEKKQAIADAMARLKMK